MTRAATTIDIIIPVFRGLSETRRCIESVLASAVRTGYELVVIEDCSPETDLVDYLQTLSKQGRITLLQNTENVGFVATVNKGMQLHTDRDVLLLNSDTEVADDWLDRLHCAAHLAENIGTVTPFSNSATILSYPFPGCDPKLVTPEDLPIIDACFAASRLVEVIDIPTAVGFCMLIRRACLDEVGYFDSDTFGMGYGEECDFSRRAMKKGWRNVLATNVFVYHVGGISFGSERLERMRQAETLMAERHPDYGPSVEDFIRVDALSSVRLAVDRCLISRQPAHCSRWYELRIKEMSSLRDLANKTREELHKSQEMYRVTDIALGEAQKIAHSHLQALRQLQDESQKVISQLESVVHQLTQEKNELQTRWNWIANTRLGRIALWFKEKFSGD